MKITTVTVHHAHNYGAMLQAYGLQKALVYLGYETEILDYDEIHSKIFIPLNFSGMKSFGSAIYYNLKIFFRYFEYKRAYSKFENFYENYMKKSKLYACYEDIHELDSDLLLAGSDQIWNLKRGKNRPFFQLDFSDSIPKASYAASMGSFFNLDKEIAERFKNSLKDFSAISVREKETGDYIKGLSEEFEYNIHIDPVFLLERREWEELSFDACKYNLPDNYILCYELLPQKEISECIEKIKRMTGYPVVVLTPNVYSKQKGTAVIRDAGPLEMLSLIKNAKCVVTTSYHGTMFSILFEKPFYSVLTSHGKGRIQEVLKNMQLENRIYDKETRIDLHCDFRAANYYVEAQRKHAYNYLKSLQKLEEK